MICVSSKVKVEIFIIKSLVSSNAMISGYVEIISLTFMDSYIPFLFAVKFC